MQDLQTDATPPGRAARGLAAAMTLLQAACAACVAGMAFAVVYEIVARTVFGEPTVWAQEVSVYLLLAVAFLGLAPALVAGEHIEIDLLTRRLGRRARRSLRVVILLAIAGYAFVAASGGVAMVLQSLRFGQRSPTLLAVPVWIPQLLIPVGMGLLGLAALVGAWRVLRGERMPSDG